MAHLLWRHPFDARSRNRRRARNPEAGGASGGRWCGGRRRRLALPQVVEVGEKVEEKVVEKVVCVDVHRFG